ncbi:hypothetical protein DsansV1_C27g0201281 [Dioscorea sansibarensis]
MQGTARRDPGLWNSHPPHSFYVQEVTCIDLTVDISSGSPTSWESRLLNRIMEVDVSQVRKKWGCSHLPTLIAMCPINQVMI